MLPEYTGTNEIDRGEYLLQNADAIARHYAEKHFGAERNVVGGSRMIETAPEAAKFMSDLQRADEMSETRSDRVEAAVDEAFLTSEQIEIYKDNFE